MEENKKTIKEELELRASLQKKKNLVRKALKKKGTLKRGGKNDYDKYSYFSEAQYKELFTELFSENGVELKTEVEEVNEINGTDKQPFGIRVKMLFELFDVETGYSEATHIFGEGLDKGDKALYKAYTGALKYYLANTFMVATGDDPETESPEGKKTSAKATPKQVEIIKNGYAETLDKLLEFYKIEKVEDLDVKTASGLIAKLKERSEASHAVSGN